MNKLLSSHKLTRVMHPAKETTRSLASCYQTQKVSRKFVVGVGTGCKKSKGKGEERAGFPRRHKPGERKQFAT